MKFDERFPDANSSGQYPFEGSVMLKLRELGACAVCLEITEWVDLYFECFMCSEECDREMWKGYFEALNHG